MSEVKAGRTALASTSGKIIGFTIPDEFLWELRLDLEDGLAGAVVRLSTMRQTAKLEDVDPGRPGGDRGSPNWRRVWVECSYVNGLGQIVKLSRTVGIECIAEDLEVRERIDKGRSTVTLEAQLELEQKLKRILGSWEVKLRGGGTFVDDGPWVASESLEISEPKQEICATCLEPIHYAEHWRHTATNRPEALVDKPCQTCKGEGETRGRRCLTCHGLGVIVGGLFTHYADPALVGLQILAD